MHASEKKLQEDNWMDQILSWEPRDETEANDSGQKQSIKSVSGCGLEQWWEELRDAPRELSKTPSSRTISRFGAQRKETYL